MPLRTALTQRLDLANPVIQAPMGGADHHGSDRLGIAKLAALASSPPPIFQPSRSRTKRERYARGPRGHTASTSSPRFPRRRLRPTPLSHWTAPLRSSPSWACRRP